MLELYFRFFFVQSDGFGITYAHKKWMQKYWKPINSLNLRDREWSKKDLSNRNVIAVIGDSFVAGNGIEDVSDRFSNILEKKLDNNHFVINAGASGFNTRMEYQVLSDFVTLEELETIIWSYFPNDIQDAAHSFGRMHPYAHIGPKGSMKWLISKSYFFNFAYWRVARLGIIGQTKNYSLWLKGQFKDPDVMRAHKEELESVINLCRTNNKKLIVVLFPFLLDTKESSYALGKVKDIFQAHNVPVLEVSELIKNLKVKDIIANKVDTHPSEKVHKLVAEALYPMVLQISGNSSI